MFNSVFSHDASIKSTKQGRRTVYSVVDLATGRELRAIGDSSKIASFATADAAKAHARALNYFVGL